jgi:hypothetical protein
MQGLVTNISASRRRESVVQKKETKRDIEGKKEIKIWK